MSYAELQVTTHFSFLRGAASAQELFETAKQLGIEAIGVVDRNSLAGIVRALEASRAPGSLRPEYIRPSGARSDRKSD